MDINIYMIILFWLDRRGDDDTRRQKAEQREFSFDAGDATAAVAAALVQQRVLTTSLSPLPSSPLLSHVFHVFREFGPPLPPTPRIDCSLQPAARFVWQPKSCVSKLFAQCQQAIH